MHFSCGIEKTHTHGQSKKHLTSGLKMQRIEFARGCHLGHASRPGPPHISQQIMIHLKMFWSVCVCVTHNNGRSKKSLKAVPARAPTHSSVWITLLKNLLHDWNIHTINISLRAAIVLGACRERTFSYTHTYTHTRIHTHLQSQRHSL